VTETDEVVSPPRRRCSPGDLRLHLSSASYRRKEHPQSLALVRKQISESLVELDAELRVAAAESREAIAAELDQVRQIEASVARIDAADARDH
jgi:hypothetical protein